MKPAHSILDNSFHYVPAMATSVSDTWSRFGWRPTTEADRRRRAASSTMGTAATAWTHERSASESDHSQPHRSA
jgi:hypothetical protein